jgi:hypothetical protein
VGSRQHLTSQLQLQQLTQGFTVRGRPHATLVACATRATAEHTLHTCNRHSCVTRSVLLLLLACSHSAHPRRAPAACSST